MHSAWAGAEALSLKRKYGGPEAGDKAWRAKASADSRASMGKLVSASVTLTLPQELSRMLGAA
jgi:hypothetical protein